ncbi:tetratricopeptide repeat-containing sensor histidine kinase [Pleomorphovibrio marinus]|uniref:tetratricopeptide repeat-containing sensor histidine kinase n=1 Tax=Pleomorphovibrio marinus TaxID=2164132 RepID=UPI000E0B1DB4|nr:histidine kinase [Pleomorphovibrio marinus]
MGRVIFVLILGFAIPLQSQSQSAKIDSLIFLLDTSTNHSQQIDAAIMLSREIHSTEHDEEKEYGYAQFAVEKAEDLGDTLLMAKAMDNLGLLYRFHELFAKAVPLHIRAFELVENKDVDPYYPMRFANNAGVASRYHQALDQAAHYYLKALRIAEQEEDLRNIAIASNGLGNALSQLKGREEEAKQFFTIALSAEEKRENTLGMAINYLSIADYFTQISEYDSARNYLDTLLKINQGREDDFGIAMTYEYFGHNQLAEGKDLALAKRYYEDALLLFRALDNQTKECQMLNNLGEIARLQNNIQEAKSLFLRALSMAEGLENKQLIVDNSMVLAEIAEMEADYEMALTRYKTAQTFRDSINMSRQETEISAMKMEYDFQKKESEIALLKKDQVLQEAALNTEKEKLRRQRAILVFLIISVVGAALLVIQFIKNLNIKKNTMILLQEQEQKRLKTVYENNLLQAQILASRMQMNPHFLFNCLNSVKYLIQTGTYKEAIRYLTTFSRFVREILESGKKTTISLKGELDLIDRYVRLERNRFDQELLFELSMEGITEDDLEGIEVPPMLLQPFVENAIWHGLLPSARAEKKLQLSVAKEGEDIRIVLTDNGVGRSNIGGNTLHKSMGTKITRERIALFNKDKIKKISFGFVDLKDKAGIALGTQVVIQLGKNVRQQPEEDLVLT